MSASTGTTWTCDRCGVHQWESERMQPQMWIGVLTFSPPLHADQEGDRIHLCRSCARAHREWLLTAPGQSVAADQ